MPRRGHRVQGQLPDLILEQAQRMPTMAGLPVGGRMPRMKTGKVVPEAAELHRSGCCHQRETGQVLGGEMHQASAKCCKLEG